jgi:hypothetical protein
VVVLQGSCGDGIQLVGANQFDFEFALSDRVVAIISEISHGDAFGWICGVQETDFGRLLCVDSGQETEVVVRIIEDSFVNLQYGGLI